MTQFIAVTADGTGKRVRLNVAEVQSYSRGPADPNTEVVLCNGNTFMVTESMPALDGLIQNTDGNSVISKA